MTTPSQRVTMTEEIIKNNKGCPCSNDCCNNPDIFCPDHECPENEFCEDCYVNECANCGSSCFCDL